MNDERILILQMLEKGKISVEEAAALLAALDGSSDPENDESTDEDPTASNEAGTGPKEYVDTTRERVEQSLKQIRETVRQKAPGTEEINSWVKTVQKGISQVIDELPDVMNRIFNWEFRAGPGLLVEESYSGTFEPGSAVTIRVHNSDGPIQVSTSDSDSYQVRVVNRVRVAETAEAQEISKEIVEWHASDTGFELTVGDHPKVSTQVHLALPVGIPYSAHLSSEDGSIMWRALNADRIKLVTADGSIQVNEAAVRVVHLHTSDGSIAIRQVQADEVDANSADGSVRFEGFASQLRCKTADGSIRARLQPANQDALPRPELSWELITADGSVSATLPTSDDFGYRLNLATSDGHIAVGIPGIETVSAGKSGYTGQSIGFEEKPVRATLSVRTADGSVRISPLEQGADQ